MKTKNFEQLRSDYLRDLSNQQPAAHTHPGSDNFARATALAALAEGQYQHQEWILRQVFTAKNVQVMAPQRVPLNVSVRVSLADGYTLPAVKDAAARALSAYFATIKPGDTVYKSHIEALISDTPGVRDRVLDSPAANQNATITPHIQWLALGTFEMTLL